eukprot:CAMPEP_0178400164 /NCGR_PEP_ID=MMETSP0689_2-20121128/15649_1 /TAXON_ID=160604 /ORGANISM="Amphidinium massartii, Strain CS-259" /LENGTH=173 /DNA_ID=CAMNT_0020020953 /DNA_START=113 /DNA_END=634 /DNA_ORIENTATION=+
MQSIKAKLQSMLLNDATLHKISDGIFMKYDRDRSGHLDQREVDVAVNDLLRRLHIPAPPGVGQQAMRYCDKDRSGTVDREEFFLIVQKAVELSGVGKQQAYTRAIDMNQFADVDLDAAMQPQPQAAPQYYRQPMGVMQPGAPAAPMQQFGQPVPMQQPGVPMQQFGAQPVVHR